MNDKQHIKDLLEDYFAGGTSMQEEQVLKAYFQEPNIDSEFQEYQTLFQFFETESRLELPKEFEESFFADLEQAEKPRLFIRKMLPWVSRVAAALLIGTSIFWIWPETNSKAQADNIDWSKYEPDTPEEALRIYQSAMLKLGTALQEGTKTAAKTVQRVEEVSQFFE